MRKKMTPHDKPETDAQSREYTDTIFYGCVCDMLSSDKPYLQDPCDLHDWSADYRCMKFIDLYNIKGL